jgi:hypothetical protein
MGTFDLADIVLVAPNSGATSALPVTFQWISRPSTPLDSYELNLYNPANLNQWWRTVPPLGYVNTYTLNGLPSGFAAGVQYAWFTAAYSPDGGYGESYWAPYITFSGAQALTEQSPLQSPARDVERMRPFGLLEH